MIRSFTKPTGFFLAMISICHAEPSISKSGEIRTDGMVSIGGVLYSEEEMKDPEKRRKTEQAIKRIQQLKELERKPRDYLNITTEELFRTVLRSTGNVHFRDDLKELSERPAETKAAIDSFLENENPFYGDLLFFSILPSVAEVLGTEYHVEVVKRILNHPLAKKYDEVLLEDKTSSIVGGGLLDHLATSGKDETGTLDKLIAEGRIERGSELELKWRKRLSGDHREEKNRPEKNGLENVPTHGQEAGKSQNTDPESEIPSNWSYLALGGLTVLSLGILALLFKVWKGRAAR